MTPEQSLARTRIWAALGLVSGTLAICYAATWISTRMAAGTFKDWGEGLAWVSAGVFFLYRAFTGYFITNMSVAIKCRRRSVGAGKEDILVVTLNLRKGPSGTVAIHDAQARISWHDPGNPEAPTAAIVDFAAVNRRSYQTDKTGRKKIAWNLESVTNPFTNLSPTESTHFVCYQQVPAQAVCDVEVTVMGQVVWSRYTSEWRASTVSLPTAVTSEWIAADRRRAAPLRQSV